MINFYLDLIMPTSSQDARNQIGGARTSRPPPTPTEPATAVPNPVDEVVISSDRMRRIKTASTASRESPIKVLKKEINPKVTKVVAETGPNDPLIAEDVYGPSGAKILGPLSIAAVAAKIKNIARAISPKTIRDKNKAASAAAAASKGSSGAAISANANDQNAAKRSLDQTRSGIEKTRDAVRKASELKEKIDRLKNVFGNRPAMINMLGDTVLNQMVSNDQMSHAQRNRVKVVVDGVVRTANYADISTTKGVFNLFSNVLGNQSLVSVIDTGTKTKALKELFDYSIRLGAPEFIDKMIEKDPNDEAVNKALEYTMTASVYNGDLSTTSKIVNQIGVNKTKEIMPDIAQQLMQSYSLPEYTKPSQYHSIAIEYKALMEKLDPDWMYVERNGEMVLRLEHFTRASSDFKKMAVHLPEIRDALLIAPHYRRVSLRTQARQMYPYIAF